MTALSKQRAVNSRRLKENAKSIGIIFFLCLLLALLLPAGFSGAQQSKKVPHVCYLGSGATEAAIYLEPFHKRLRELNYIEGQSITFEYHHFEGKIERAPELAADLARTNCDVILTTGTEAVVAAKGATQTIPVVMGFSGDAVQLGIVAELARPGGNITGLTSINIELTGKRLELLKAIVPKLSRVALIWSPGNPNTARIVKESETAARPLHLEIQSIKAENSNDFEGAFQLAAKKHAEALILGGGGFFSPYRKRIVELAARYRLPATYPNSQFVEAGGLMAYTEDRTYMSRRAAEYVDKILKGTKPADLPVEQPTKFEFVINLKTAKQIGLTIPPNVLARADRVIR
jgi:putative tryptophan/tyrosine transport system substrate-binding protein